MLLEPDVRFARHSMANTDTTSQLVTPNATSDDETLVVADGEWIQLHSRRNLVQLAAVLVFIAIGAIIGYFLTDDRPALTAMAGGITGMIVGTFASGFVLMLLPEPTVRITLGEIRNKHIHLKRRLMVAAIAFISCMLLLPLVISRFDHDDSTFAWVICLLWICATTGLSVYTKMLVHRLREWKCPACGQPFGRLWSSCNNCGL